jgi:AcrR family transcriptional regulator
MYVVNHGPILIMRRTKQDAEKTRQKIIDAAVDVFSTQGVAKTTIEQIAKAAKVTRGAVYWHFKNKKEVFEAVHDDVHTPFIQEIIDGLENSHDAPLTQLKALCIKLLCDLETNEKKQAVLRIFMLKCDYSDELHEYRETLLARRREKLTVFSKYFELAEKNNSLPPGVSPQIMTLAITSYLRGIIIEYLENPQLFKLSQQAPQLINLFFRNVEG